MLGFLLSLCLGVATVGAVEKVAGSQDTVKMASVDRPAWLDKLEKQIDYEEMMSGLEGRREKLEKTFRGMKKKFIDQVQEHVSPASAGGGFHDSWAAHQMGQSYLLGPSQTAVQGSVGGGHCLSSAPVKTYDITAINVEITLNQWGDYYPGYMFAITSHIPAIRAEEARNAKARESFTDPGAVTNGAQGDEITPLNIRGNQGDCIRFKVTNGVEDEDIGFQVNGSAMIISSSGAPVTAATAGAIIPAGGTAEFEWQIPVDEQEGVHTITSHAGRDPQALGLMGAFVVEQMGSVYLSPWEEGKPLENGWEAIIHNPNPKIRDFREFTLFYHEIGDESFRPLNSHGEMIPQRDPQTDAYRPSARALNYRSEPFGINPLANQEKSFHFEDESLAYSSYTFGDTPTTIPRSYLGDPAKFRLVHGGGEVFHSHHPHGGTIRWQRSPKREVQENNLLNAGWWGPVKYPVVRTTTDRVDVEVIGPSEALDLQLECGSGLCQHMAGDFLFHCHVAHHYVAGMWGYWRVYNTL
ncbi:MAG: hypothetical protein ACE5G9_14020, partial [Nitrospinales bacterium]